MPPNRLVCAGAPKAGLAPNPVFVFVAPKPVVKKVSYVAPQGRLVVKL